MSEEYKCKDCKWLTGRKNIRGIECMNPVLQKKWNGAKNLWMGELRKDTARYKQRNAPACKKFEAKESEHMGRYIDAKAAIARIAGQMSYEIEVETRNETDCVDLAEELLNDIPSIDIVRCKECKYWTNNLMQFDNNLVIAPCKQWLQYTRMNGYCHNGERKESE